MKTSWIAVCCVLVVACTIPHRCFAIDCWVADDKDTCEELYGPKKNFCGEVQDCRYSEEATNYVCSKAYQVLDDGNNHLFSVRKKTANETGWQDVKVSVGNFCGKYMECECQKISENPLKYQCADFGIWRINRHNDAIPYGDQHNCMPSGYGDGGGGGYGDGGGDGNGYGG